MALTLCLLLVSCYFKTKMLLAARRNKRKGAVSGGRVVVWQNTRALHRNFIFTFAGELNSPNFLSLLRERERERLDMRRSSAGASTSHLALRATSYELQAPRWGLLHGVVLRQHPVGKCTRTQTQQKARDTGDTGESNGKDNRIRFYSERQSSSPTHTYTRMRRVPFPQPPTTSPFRPLCVSVWKKQQKIVKSPKKKKVTKRS